MGFILVQFSRLLKILNDYIMETKGITIRFNIKPVEHKSKIKKENNFTIIKSKVKGIIIKNNDNTFSVKVEDKYYNLTSKSYETKNKKILYSRNKVDNRYLKIIRERKNRIKVNTIHYLPFKKSLYVLGDIIKIENGKFLYDIISILNNE